MINEVKTASGRKTRLTHFQSHRLLNYLEAQAIDGHIDATLAELRESANTLMDFEAADSTIRNLLKECGITYGTREKANGQPTDVDYAMVLNQVSRVERKINLLLNELNIKFTD